MIVPFADSLVGIRAVASTEWVGHLAVTTVAIQVARCSKTANCAVDVVILRESTVLLTCSDQGPAQPECSILGTERPDPQAIESAAGAEMSALNLLLQCLHELWMLRLKTAELACCLVL